MGSEVSHVCSQSNFPLRNVLLLGHVQTVLQTPAQQHIPGQHTLWVGQENISASLLPVHGDMRADKERCTGADDLSQEYGFRPSAF